MEEISERIVQILGFSFFILHPFFLVLFGVMLFYVAFVLLVPLISFFVNVIRHWMHERDERIRNSYKPILFEYMISGEMPVSVSEKLAKKGNKRILIDLIYDLLLYMKGDEALRLRKLFDDLELYKYVAYRLASPFGYKKAYYLKRLSLASSTERAMRVAKSLVNNRYGEVRLAAIQAIIRMQPERMEELFLNYPYKLSLWEQMCYYNFFAYSGLPVPDFHPLAFSKNDSVVLFAIRMVRMFNQRLGSIDGYEFLLSYPSMDIQGEMFRTLAEFGYTDLGQLLNNYLPSMPLLIRMHIMTFLAKRPESTIESMMKYYWDSDSPEFRLHVLFCIYNFVKNGKEEIERFTFQKEDKTLHDLSSHLITNVL